jgi:hypothetical protein
MVAVWLGNVNLIQDLSEREPDTELVDNNQRNALQISLIQATQDAKYAERALSTVYHLLTPDSLSIQVEGRLVKLDNHLMEFVMLNLLISLFYRVMPMKMLNYGGFQAGDILDAIAHFPHDVLPVRRKQRAYVSSILSKNEVNREGRYNRKLFQRVKIGHYVFNPDLSLKIEGQWIGVYDICQIDRLRFYAQKGNWWAHSQNIDERTKAAKRDLKGFLGLE